MSDPRQLPHLLDLLDDDSPVVRKAVVRELESFGPALREELLVYADRIGRNEQRLLSNVLSDYRRAWLSEAWPSWFDLDTFTAKLESAFTLVSGFRRLAESSSHLGGLLDDLAGEFQASQAPAEPRALARFLFKTRQFRGARSSYYDPDNSDLVRVIESGRGIPISMACLYILVGQRAGITIGGCSFPRHFLARFQDNDGTWLVDCFHGGRVLSEQEVLRMNPSQAPSIRTILRMEASAETIMARVLRNLGNAFRRLGSRADYRLMKRLLRLTENEMVRRQLRGLPRASTRGAGDPAFVSGQLVRHRRYGYRGVVVDHDPHCQAGEAWYRANATRPDRNQPWYHVLVHESDQVTYAAQSSLSSDESGETVRHPLVPHFFAGFESGFYLRNNQPWPYHAPSWEAS